MARVCAALGVPHEVRVWDHGEVPGNLMDAARRARMALICDWAQARGIGVWRWAIRGTIRPRRC